MSKNKYNNDIYTMYEKELEKNQKITSKYNKLRWEVVIKNLIMNYLISIL